MKSISLRPATVADATAVQAIYAPMVENTAISFEEVPPTPMDIAGRIEATLRDYPYLVATDGNAVIGYAYASQHRARAAYRWSVDVSVYVADQTQGSGVGSALYARLLEDLASRGFHAAFAGIALPNERSVALHEKMGFAALGVYREVGYKFGKWHDVGWWQRLL